MGHWYSSFTKGVSAMMREELGKLITVFLNRHLTFFQCGQFFFAERAACIIPAAIILCQFGKGVATIVAVGIC